MTRLRAIWLAGKHYDRIHVRRGKPMQNKRKYADVEKKAALHCSNVAFEAGDDHNTPGTPPSDDDKEDAAATAPVLTPPNPRRAKRQQEYSSGSDCEWDGKSCQKTKRRRRRRVKKGVLPLGGRMLFKPADLSGGEGSAAQCSDICAFCAGWKGTVRCPFHDEEEQANMVFVGDIRNAAKDGAWNEIARRHAKEAEADRARMVFAAGQHMQHIQQQQQLHHAAGNDNALREMMTTIAWDDEHAARVQREGATEDDDEAYWLPWLHERGEMGL